MNLPENFWQDLADNLIRGDRTVEQYEERERIIRENPDRMLWKSERRAVNVFAMLEIFPHMKSFIARQFKNELKLVKTAMESCMETETEFKMKYSETSNINERQWYQACLETNREDLAKLLAKQKRLAFQLARLNTPDKPELTKNSIGPAEIDRAKQVDILNYYPNKLIKKGKLLCGVCPFHVEKTGSFFIYPNNTWYCQGQCAAGGDSISFIQKMQNIGFIEAVKFLIGK